MVGPTEVSLGRRATKAACIVYALSCVFHAAVAATLSDNLEVCCLTPDSYAYLALSRGEMANLMRTPGYPALLWLIRQVAGPSIDAIVWVQVFVISAVPALVAYFSAHAFPQFPQVPYISGILNSASFTGILLGHQIMTEVLFAPLVWGAFIALYFGVLKGREVLIVLSAIIGGIAFLAKPVFLFWGGLIPVLALMIGNGRRPRGRVLLMSAAVGLAFPVGWSAVNLAKCQVFTPSASGTYTVYGYLSSRTLAYSALPKRPTRDEIRDQIKAQRAELHRDLSATWVNLENAIGTCPRQDVSRFKTHAEALRFMSSRSREILLGHPLAALRAYRDNVLENLPRPFDPVHLGWGRSGPSLIERLILGGLFGLNFLLYLLALVGAVRLLLGRDWGLLAGLLLLFGTFSILTGTSYFVGSRLMYPVEPILILLVSLALSRRESSVSPSRAAFSGRSSNQQVASGEALGDDPEAERRNVR